MDEAPRQDLYTRREASKLIFMGALGFVLNPEAALATPEYTPPHEVDPSKIRYGLALTDIPASVAAGGRVVGTYNAGQLIRYAPVPDRGNPQIASWAETVRDTRVIGPARQYTTGLWLPMSRDVRELTPQDVAPIQLQDGEERWVEVIIGEQHLYVHSMINGQYAGVLMDTPVSTGSLDHPTPTGDFLLSTGRYSRRMVGADFDTDHVPFVQYISRTGWPDNQGVALHGAGWHDDFGTRRSHGCVNLPVKESGELWQLMITSPMSFRQQERRYARPTHVLIH